MSTSLYAPDFLAIFNRYRDTGGPLQAFASPADWRDQWIYFLMVDRFNNSLRRLARAIQPFDDPNYYDFQGGNLASIQDQLPYIKQLGAGAIWLSPVLKNCSFSRRERITATAFTIFCTSIPASPAIPTMPTMSFARWSMPLTISAST